MAALLRQCAEKILRLMRRIRLNMDDSGNLRFSRSGSGETATLLLVATITAADVDA